MSPPTPPALIPVGCPLCGRHHEAVAIEEGGYTGRRCADCGLIYVSPRPPPEAMLALYEHDAAHTRSRHLIAKARAPHAVAHARLILRLLRPWAPRGSLLEIGAGGGILLREARELGYEVAAIEPNPVLADFMRDEHHIAVERAPLSETSLGGRRLDVIVHINVLSHLADPVESLRAMARRLQPGGVLLFETGNFADVDPRYHPLLRRTERFQLPDHLTFFGEASIRALVEAAGLELCRVHRYSRIPEKLGPRLLGALGLRRLVEPLKHALKYRLGAWFPKRGRPCTIITIARAPADPRVSNPRDAPTPCAVEQVR